MSARKVWPPAWFVGEFVGTFLLVFFGCGSVAAAVLAGAQVGVFQVAIVWGLGIATAIYLTADLSGAHLNPAVTVALAAFKGFSWKLVPGYYLAQFSGALVASGALLGVFHGAFRAYEAAHGIVRGAPGSEATAMVFGEFYPNPGGRALTDAARAMVPPSTAFFIEVLGTAVLVLVILGITDERNRSRPRSLAAVTIGLTVTLLISLLGPLTMACFNPARDLAPRVFSYFAGWGSVVFNANGSGWLMVYVIAPIVGGLMGGFIYRRCLAPHYLANPSDP